MSPEGPLEKLRRLDAQEAASRAARSPEPIRPRGRAAGIGAAALLLLTKGKLAFLFLLTKLKLVFVALKFGPLLGTFTTMGLSVWAYARYYGAGLAAAVVALILVHELGHGYAARRLGLKVGAPIFIPFFGAVITLKEQPQSTWQEAVVGFGGPLAGGASGALALAAGGLLGAGHAGGFLRALAHVTLTLNLFNLIPAFGLDGDRVTQPLKPNHWLPGMAWLAALTALATRFEGGLNPILLLLVLVGGVKGGRAWWLERERASGRAMTRFSDKLLEDGRYRQEAGVTPEQRRLAAWAYFGWAGLLALLTLTISGLPRDT